MCSTSSCLCCVHESAAGCVHVACWSFACGLGRDGRSFTCRGKAFYMRTRRLDCRQAFPRALHLPSCEFSVTQQCSEILVCLSACWRGHVFLGRAATVPQYRRRFDVVVYLRSCNEREYDVHSCLTLRARCGAVRRVFVVFRSLHSQSRARIPLISNRLCWRQVCL